MIRSTIVPMYYKDYFVNFAPEPYFGAWDLMMSLGYCG